MFPFPYNTAVPIEPNGLNVGFAEGKGDFVMKIVVIKSPKFLSGILRLIFKIKKEDLA